MNTNQLGLDAARARAAASSPLEDPKASKAVVTVRDADMGIPSTPVMIPVTNEALQATGEGLQPMDAIVASGPSAAEMPTESHQQSQQIPVEPEVSKRRPFSESKLGGLLSRMLTKMREDAARKKQKEEDEKLKTANTRKKNRSPYLAVAVMIFLGGAGLYVKHSFTEKENLVKAQAEEARKKKDVAIKTVAGMLDGKIPATATTTSPGQSTSAPSDAQPGTTAPRQSFGPTEPGEDRYLAQLKLLKGGIQDATAPTAPSVLPPEIASADVPGRGAQRAAAGPDTSGTREYVRSKPPVADQIEGATAQTVVRPDPLDHVNVVSNVRVERSLPTPYAIKVIRSTEDGMAAFVYHRNSDPLLSGQWYFEGDQTPDGWSVVKIEAEYVKVVSPAGKVYRIQS